MKVPTDTKTHLCYTKWYNSHWLQREPRCVLPGWNEPSGLILITLIQGTLMRSIVTLSLLHPGVEGALLEDDAFLKGTGLPQGAIRISLQIIQAAKGEWAHNGNPTSEMAWFLEK